MQLVQGGWCGPNCTSHSLHVTGPRHCPRIDKPHSATIASTRPAVARRPFKQVAQVVRNRAFVPNWHKRKFSQDILDRDDIQAGFFVVKLINNLGSNRLQPSCRNDIVNLICIIRITRIICIMYNNAFNTYNTYNICNAYMHKPTIFRIVICFHNKFHCRHKCTVEGLGSSVRLSRGWKQEQYSGIPWWPDCIWRHNFFAGNGLQHIRWTPGNLVCPSTKQL